MARVNISELNIQITGNAAGLLSATNSARGAIGSMGTAGQNSARQLKSSFSEFNEILARTIALYATFKAFDAVRAGVFDSVRLAANAEQSAIAFEVLLGSAESAKEVIADLYKFVETTPFRLEEVREATSLLLAFGFEQEKIFPTLRSLGDVASATGVSIKELAELFGRTKVEQRLYTRDLVQFVSRGIDVLSVMADQFGVTETAIKEMATAGTLSFSDIERAFAAITSSGGQYFELTKRQAETTAGEFSNFLDEVDALKREFGAGLLPTLREFLGLAREIIAGTDDAASALKAMKENGKLLGDAMRYVAGTFVSAYSGLILLNIGIAKLSDLMIRVQTAGFATTSNDFFSAYIEDLNRQFEDAFQLGQRLFDLRRSLFTPSAGGLGSDENSLADVLGNLTDAAIKASKELETLRANATNSADKIRQEFATPLEQFKENVREIQQAFLSGGLEPEFVDRALRGEIDALRESYQRLKNELKSNPAIERGSQEDLVQEFQAKFGSGLQGSSEDLQTLIAEIADEERKRAEDMAAQAKETAAAADKMREQTEAAAAKVNEFGNAAKSVADSILKGLVRGLDPDQRTPAGSQPTGFFSGFDPSAWVASVRDAFNESTSFLVSLREAYRLFNGDRLSGLPGPPVRAPETRKSEPTANRGSMSPDMASTKQREREDRLAERENAKDIRKEIAATSKTEVSKLTQIATLLSNLPESSLNIQIVEYSA